MARRGAATAGLIVLAGIWWVGCGDDETPITDPTGVGGASVSASSVVVASVAMSSSSTGGATDEGTSCADAVALVQKDNNLGGIFFDYTGLIGEAGDLDFFTFTAEADGWLRIGADLEDTSDVNPVVTLFDATGGRQLAQNNNGIGLASFESELFFHVVAGGSYCLQVEDWSTWSGGDPVGGPTFLYRATVVPIEFDLYSYYVLDTEPNDSTAEPQAAIPFDTTDDGSLTAVLNGIFDPTSDVDVYEFVAPTDALDVNVLFGPIGVDGYGSTRSAGIVSIYESDGTTVLSVLDLEKGSDSFSSVPVVAGETYFLEIAAPATGNSGDNDFYAYKFYTSTTLNEQEADDVTNGLAAGAEAAAPEADGDTVHHYLGGTLDTTVGPDDDWWTFDAIAGDSVALACSSWRAGSGVRDAQFRIYADPAGTALESETETEDADVLWSGSSAASKDAIVVGATATYYLRVDAATQDVNVQSSHYLCGIHVTTP